MATLGGELRSFFRKKI